MKLPKRKSTTNLAVNSTAKKIEPVIQDEIFVKILENFQQLSSNPDNFLLPNEDSSLKFKTITKTIYDHGQKILSDLNVSIKSTKEKQSLKPLNNLLVDKFDNEQVWQQLELFNQPFIEHSVTEISKILSSQKPISLNIDMNLDKDLNKDNITKPILKSTDNKHVKFNLEKPTTKIEEVKSTVNKFDFFNHEEMERFLDEQDEKEMQQDNNNNADDDIEQIDHLYEFPSDDDDEDDDDDNDNDEMMYSDFFDPPPGTDKQNTMDVEDEEEEDGFEDADVDLDTRDFDMNEYDNEEDDDDEENEINKKLKALANNDDDIDDIDGDPDKSEYEKSQLRLQQKIKKAEQELLLPSNLRWQFAGETNAGVRPSNSLLEEHLQFDHVARPPPLITDETTTTLEGLIKQRIKDKVFDDVERKVKPKEQPFEFRRRIMLESEKSKIGLAEVYEQEYLKQQQKQKEQEIGTATDAFVSVGEAEESETRKEIRRQIRSLFRKLDSLSAFHYTPRPPVPEVKILTNLPAVTVEEVVPDSVSDMKLLAPEEVFILQDKGERTQTDKKRARRLKKKKQGVKQKFIQSKMKLNVSDKSTKRKSEIEAFEDGKSLKSSTKFFERLQEKNELQKIQKKAKPIIIQQANLAKKLKL
ncbi:u3 small nucleolar ribonucleoprotein MPP10 [Dermatophagoides pteronyssinus]|uniref:U3 small nucleolar ribonucleoprotein protein MPP10 n=1 Tax=Dermatophagoides pteronyssinus TaxID=6956 RepID=A0ABQ8JVK5_DERPT|nr:u3 small nucleolar ribonucleoprotein MPP10 [Dermatophagoides pteronyssinus]